MAHLTRQPLSSPKRPILRIGMRVRLRYPLAVLLLGLGCQSTGPDQPRYIVPDDYGQETERLGAEGIPAAFAEENVVGTYTLFGDRALSLEDALADLAEDPSSDNLEAAQAAWYSAREPWQVCAAFMFGPILRLGFYVSLDTWPIDISTLEFVLEQESEIGQAEVASLDNTLQGLHTIEYLLFGPSGDREASDLTERELVYLGSVAAQIVDEGTELTEAWTIGTDVHPAYVDLFGKAGADGNTMYTAPEYALYEIGRGISGGLEEMAEVRLSALLEAEEPSDVESHFSVGLRQDLLQSLKGVRSAYLGRNHLTDRGEIGRSRFIL